MPRLVLGDAVMLGFSWLLIKPSHVRVDVDGLALPLHRLTVYGHQTRGRSSLSDIAPSGCAAVGGGTFSRGVKPPSLDI
jgi:hypothetical protein